MSRSRCAAVLAAVLVACACVAPGTAAADAEWLRPVDGAVALAYGETWVDPQARACTHGGLDLLAPAGASVAACAAGEVVFAGLVPAGEGARAYAVTVLVAGDLRVTYLPLASVSVRRGQGVSAGSALGTVASTGDGSSLASHLHLGVRRGSAALDPAAFLRLPAAVPNPSPGPAPAAPRVTRGKVPAQRFAPSPQAGSAAAPAPSPDAAELVRLAAQGAAAALALVAPAVRVEPVSAPAVLDLDRAAADLAAGRESALVIGVRVGLAVIGGVCVLAVVRGARKAGAQAVPVAVRRDRS